MTSNTEFKSLTDLYVEHITQAQEDIAVFAVSNTGEFLREITTNTRVIFEQPDVAVRNVRTFLQENPDAVLRFSAGCLAMFKIAAQKRSRDRHPAGKGKKGPKLSVVEEQQLDEATEGLSFEEAVVDGWDPATTPVMMQESLIDLPFVTYEDRSVSFAINVARREEIIEALRAQVDADLTYARNAVADFPTEGDKAAVGWLMDLEGSLRGDKVDLYQVVSMTERMGTSVSSLCHESGRRLIGVVAKFDQS